MTDLNTALKAYVVEFVFEPKYRNLGFAIKVGCPAGATLKDDYGIRARWREGGKHRNTNATAFEIWELWNDSRLEWHRSQLVACGSYDPAYSAVDRAWADLLILDWFQRKMMTVEVVPCAAPFRPQPAPQS
jgi:hypothetical protein